MDELVSIALASLQNDKLEELVYMSRCVSQLTGLKNGLNISPMVSD